MEPVFNLPYGEFKVANYLNENIDGISVFVPSSRQEKGIDLLLYRYSKGKRTTTTIQVKQSRAYYPPKPKRPTTKRYPYYLWFNRFLPQDNADWFILVGTYAKHPENPETDTKSRIEWEEIMLAFTYDEMVDFLKRVKQKRNRDKDDQMFGFGFDEKQNIDQTRGCDKPISMNDFLIENRLDDILRSFR